MIWVNEKYSNIHIAYIYRVIKILRFACIVWFKKDDNLNSPKNLKEYVKGKVI